MAVASGAVAQSQALQDPIREIGVFRLEVFEPSRAFSRSARAQAEQRLAKLEEHAGIMSQAAITVELCRIAALADNLHSSCFFSVKAGAPLGFTALSDRFLLTSSDPANADLLGGELIGVDSHSLSKLREAGRSLTGGPAAHRDLTFGTVLNRIDLLNALGVADSSRSARYRFRLPTGGIVERSIAVKEREPGWQSLPSPDRTPWALQDRSTVYRWRDAPELDAVVIQLRGNNNRPEKKLADFLAEAEANRQRIGRTNVALDMRWDTGGNFLLNRDFMRAWPSLLPTRGRFFVLIGPATVSAGIASVAYLKVAGGDRVVLIGEPVGDRLQFFSEGDFKQLPSAGLMLLPSTERYDFRSGCRRYSDCFTSIAQPGAPTATPPEEAAELDKAYGRVPLAIENLNPDIAAPWTVRDYLEGRDPGMEAIAHLLAAPR